MSRLQHAHASTDFVTRRGNYKHKPLVKPRTRPFNPNLIWVATALRYAAGSMKNELTISRQEISRLTRLDEGTISIHTTEMERLGWLVRKRNSKGREGASYNTFRFTDSFPISTKAFTRRSSEIIKNILSWPGDIGGSEMNVLWALARLVDTNQFYSFGAYRIRLLTWFETSGSQTAEVLDRLASKKYIRIHDRLPGRSGCKPIRLAGPSGQISGTPDELRPQPAAWRARQAVFTHVQEHPGENFVANQLASKCGLSIHVVRQAAMWLEKHNRIKRESDYIPGFCVRYRALRGELKTGRRKAKTTRHDVIICEAIRATASDAKPFASYAALLADRKEPPPAKWNAASYGSLSDTNWKKAISERQNHIARCPLCSSR